MNLLEKIGSITLQLIGKGLEIFTSFFRGIKITSSNSEAKYGTSSFKKHSTMFVKGKRTENTYKRLILSYLWNIYMTIAINAIITMGSQTKDTIKKNNCTYKFNTQDICI